MNIKRILKWLIILLFVILIVFFSKYYYTSFAATRNSKFVEFSVEPNVEKSDISVKSHGYIESDSAAAINGFIEGDTYDVYKVNSTVAVDLWLDTKDEDLTYCQFQFYSTVGGLNYQKTEINPELSYLSNYITIDNDVITFDSENAETPVYLTSNKKIKLATAYYKTGEYSSIYRYEYSAKYISAKTIVKRNQEQIDSYVEKYELVISAAPTRMHARLSETTKNIIGVGWTKEVQSTTYGEYIDDDENVVEAWNICCQEVNIESYDESIIKVFSDGKVRAMSEGITKLKVSSALDQSIYTEIQIEVSQPVRTNIEDLTIKNPISKLHINDRHTLDVEITPSDAIFADFIFESSDSSVASINENGVITALKEGKTTISVYSGNLYRTMDLEVVNEVISIKIENPMQVGLAGNYYKFKCKVTPPEKAQYLKFKAISSSINPDLIDVSDSGYVSVRYYGNVKITAYVGDVEDSFYMNFESAYEYVSTKGIEIRNKHDNLPVNTTYDVDAVIIPENASNKEIRYYSSDEEVATIDENGRITTLKEGTTEITAKSMTNIGEISDYFILTVQKEDIPLLGFQLKEHNISLKAFEKFNQSEDTIDSKKIYINYNPTSTTEDKTLLCESSNNDIVKAIYGVDSNGRYILVIPGTKVGKAKVTVQSAKNENLKDELDVNVYGVNFEESNIFLDVNQEYQLKYYSSFLESTEKITDIEYSVAEYPDRMTNSTGNVLTLDQSGLIVAKDNGAASVFLKVTTDKGNIYQTSTYVVCKIRVEKITITPKIVEAVVGENVVFTTKIEPMNAMERYTTKTSSDESVVSIDGNLIKALNVGEATITITSNDTGVYDTVLIKVVSKEHDDKSICPAEPSTCVTHGHAEYEICNVCGEIVSGSNEELPLDSTNHINIDTIPAEPSTCIKHGHNEYSVCRDCGAVVSGSKEDLPLASHKGGKATCSKKAVCEVCKEEYGDFDISVHTNTKVYKAVQSTCTTHGHSEYEICTDCGRILRGSNTELPFTNHKGGVATCTKKAVCEVCGKEYGEVDRNNHVCLTEPKYEEIIIGYKKYMICNACENVIKVTSTDLPFKDVKSTDWFYDAVRFTYENEIIAGYNTTTFAPNDNLTRAMLVTILYRMEKSPDNNGKSRFSDVPSTEWYSKAVKWAVDNDIIHGYGGTNNFGPNDNIIRQDLAGILRNYASYKKKNASITASLTKFKDYKSVDSYAKISMEWAVGTGVITGNSDGTLNPKGNATRAEAAAMIQKYCNKVGR